MNNLKIFQNEQFQVRTIEIDGKPYFCASDVACALGYSNPRKAVGDHCKGVTKCDTLTSGGMQSLSYIPEGDIYRLIARSQLPEAEKFEKWVFDEVIPEIRKTGGYKLPQTYQEALRELADKQDELEKLLPKAEFYDSVTSSKDTMSIRDAAKILNMGMGQNRLYAFLRQQKILMADNRPYQRYIDAGYFKLVEQEYEQDGRTKIHYKPVVYQKGLDFIRKRILQEEEQYG